MKLKLFIFYLLLSSITSNHSLAAAGESSEYPHARPAGPVAKLESYDKDSVNSALNELFGIEDTNFNLPDNELACRIGYETLAVVNAGFPGLFPEIGKHFYTGESEKSALIDWRDTWEPLPQKTLIAYPFRGIPKNFGVGLEFGEPQDFEKSFPILERIITRESKFVSSKLEQFIERNKWVMRWYGDSSALGDKLTEINNLFAKIRTFALFSPSEIEAMYEKFSWATLMITDPEEALAKRYAYMCTLPRFKSDEEAQEAVQILGQFETKAKASLPEDRRNYDGINTLFKDSLGLKSIKHALGDTSNYPHFILSQLRHMGKEAWPSFVDNFDFTPWHAPKE